MILSSPPLQVASRADTDHTTGPGKVAITGRYDSKKDSFEVDSAYAFDDNYTAHASYGVTDEKVISLGLETGFCAFGRRSTVDATYSPPTDTAVIKAAVRQGKTKLTGIFSFPYLKTCHLKDHHEKYELDASLSGVENLKMTFDAKSKAGKVKVTRKLDPKNKIDAEYNYVDGSNKYVALTFKHQYSKIHDFAITTNYGSRKYKVEWDCKTDNGPWTVATSFPFNSRYVFIPTLAQLPAAYLTCFFMFIVGTIQPTHRRLANQAPFRVLVCLFLHKHCLLVFIF